MKISFLHGIYSNITPFAFNILILVLIYLYSMLNNKKNHLRQLILIFGSTILSYITFSLLHFKLEPYTLFGNKYLFIIELFTIILCITLIIKNLAFEKNKAHIITSIFSILIGYKIYLVTLSCISPIAFQISNDNTSIILNSSMFSLGLIAVPLTITLFTRRLNPRFNVTLKITRIIPLIAFAIIAINFAFNIYQEHLLNNNFRL